MASQLASFGTNFSSENNLPKFQLNAPVVIRTHSLHLYSTAGLAPPGYSTEMIAVSSQGLETEYEQTVIINLLIDCI